MFKKLRAMYSGWDRLQERIKELEVVVRDRTEIAVDVNRDGINHVIVIGTYQGHDFVQTYTLRAVDLQDLIQQLRVMEKYGAVRRVDAPPEVRAVVKHSYRY